MAEALVDRRIDTIDQALAFIHPERYQPATYQELPGIDSAISRLIEAYEKQERICVWGDFDVDGQTATSLLVQSLRRLGFSVSYHIPHRERESHGVNTENLARIIASGTQLILTCDTGIGAADQASYARAHGVDFVITDHHDLPHELPNAAALVNPKFLPENHALRELPGVGVAYQLAAGLVDALGSDFEIASTLDLVAMGIVSDLAVQVRDVRYLLQCGLEELRLGRRTGLVALMETAGVQQEFLSEDQIGFMLAPRMNALGRLSDANGMVEFLLGHDQFVASEFARKLEALNEKRKQLSDAVYASAKQILRNDSWLLKEDVLVLDHPHWPGGIVGLVASRLVEEYHKPVILLGHEDSGMARGSARSVPGVDISHAIATQADLLGRYGGHPLAAGLTIQSDMIPEFRRGINRHVRETVPSLADERPIQIDAYLKIESIDLDLVDDLERLSPFGPGNPALVFAAKNLKVIGTRAVGKNEDHLLIRIKTPSGHEREVIWWNGDAAEVPRGQFDLAFGLRSTSYRGVRQTQLEWNATRPYHESQVALVDQPELVIEDYRLASDPQAELKSIGLDEIQVWAEGQSVPDIDFLTRNELSPGRELVVWTTPPDAESLRRAFAQVVPKRLILFCIDPPSSSPTNFLERLAGMIKFALERKQGVFDLRSAAAALAQKERAVAVGLEYLAAQNMITIMDQTLEQYRLEKVGGHLEIDLPKDPQLEGILRETAAFRVFLNKVDIEWFREELIKTVQR